MIEFVTASTKRGTEECSVNIMIPTPHYMVQMMPWSNQGGCMMCTWYMLGTWYMVQMMPCSNQGGIQEALANDQKPIRGQ